MPTYSAILDAEIAPEAPVTTSLMTRLRDNALAYLGAPAGTVSLFRQTAAPLGWTKNTTTNNDKGIRLTTGTVGTGGSVAFSTVFGKTATDNFTIAQGNLPNYTLPDTIGISDTRVWNTSVGVTYNQAGGPFATTAGGTNWNNAAINIPVVSGSISKTGSVTLGGSGTALSAGIDIRLQYVDVIEATKD